MSFSLRAFVVGYTGETGKALVKVLAKDTRYSTVRLIGRRDAEVDYGSDSPDVAKKFTKHVVNFDKLEDSQLVFSECDVGFSALGTTLRKSGYSQMRVIDHDYTLRVAEMALESGCRELHVVTSQRADPKSRFFYLRLKGEVEEGLKAVGVFPNYLAIYRPATLDCERTESRLAERVFLSALHLFRVNSWMTSTVTLAQAMANAPFCLASKARSWAAEKGDPIDLKVHVLENPRIAEISADWEAMRESATP